MTDRPCPRGSSGKRLLTDSPRAFWLCDQAQASIPLWASVSTSGIWPDNSDSFLSGCLGGLAWKALNAVPTTRQGEGCWLTWAVMFLVMTISHVAVTYTVGGKTRAQRAQPEEQSNMGTSGSICPLPQTQYLCPSSSHGRCRRPPPCSSCRGASSQGVMKGQLQGCVTRGGPRREDWTFLAPNLI